MATSGSSPRPAGLAHGGRRSSGEAVAWASAHTQWWTGGRAEGEGQEDAQQEKDRRMHSRRTGGRTAEAQEDVQQEKDRRTRSRMTGGCTAGEHEDTQQEKGRRMCHRRTGGHAAGGQEDMEQEKDRRMHSKRECIPWQQPPDKVPGPLTAARPHWPQNPTAGDTDPDPDTAQPRHSLRLSHLPRLQARVWMDGPKQVLLVTSQDRPLC